MTVQSPKDKLLEAQIMAQIYRGLTVFIQLYRRQPRRQPITFAIGTIATQVTKQREDAINKDLNQREDAINKDINETVDDTNPYEAQN